VATVLVAAVVSTVLLGAVLLLGAGGDDGPDVADGRADQVRRAALEAGLDADVADVLALAARGATATFQVTYPGEGGAAVLVSQAPPDRRVDALTAGLIVQSQVLHDGVSYACQLPAGAQPGDDLECRRNRSASIASGTFTPEALAEFTTALADQLEAVDLAVESRTVADVEATCLVSTPKAGTVIDGTEPSVDTLCLAPDGAQLLVDVGGQRVVADTYRPSVPAGTFDV
jgi:hypothetical protein